MTGLKKSMPSALVGLAGAIGLVACGISEPPHGGVGRPEQVDLTPRSGVEIASDSVTFEDVAVRAGDRVRLRKRSGTFKPEDTGHSAEVEGEAGRTGVALGGVTRSGFGAEPIQVVLVRFDAQDWREWTRENGAALTADIPLQSFEATVHIDHLEVLRH